MFVFLTKKKKHGNCQFYFNGIHTLAKNLELQRVKCLKIYFQESKEG